MESNIEVLFLDDEVNILKSLTRVFMDESYRVVTTTDPQEAFKLIENENIKVVVSDQRMPLMEGDAFLKEVRKRRPHTIRILLTGYADIQAAENAINEGQVYRFVNKPWNDEDLKRTIKEAIEHYGLADENRRLFALTKKQNEELVEANKRLENMFEKQRAFTSTVSHELRTPLAAMKMSMDLIADNAEEKMTEDDRVYFRIAKESVDRLGRLINDILDLSKLESGNEELNLKANDIHKMLNDVVWIQNPVAQEKGLYLKANLDEKVMPFLFDSDKLSQVLHNLVSNAIKFTESGGITVSTKWLVDDEKIEIAVEDTGIGVPSGEQGKLFQKFTQLGNSVSQVKGTGLGLAICKEIVERHMGKLWYEPRYDGGSRFVFTLPMHTYSKKVV